ncbi:MAG: hypothetical protein PHF08_05635 [Candidatus Riflebacteria bacterium]|nr:hypothetical protein [Candidatus Riflebacteria bacterium]
MNRRDRKGFAYVVAVLILGLLAFMGLFLQQSSTAEYSQASMSVYRTITRQLAEAAADEAFVLLEKRFENKDEQFFKLLLQQAATSGTPKGGKPTGLNPTLLGDFTDLKDKVTQVLILKDYHITRAGFEIEKILPTIKDCRPIPNGPLDEDTAYHHSTDRKKKFDNEFSKDWYLTLRLDIRIGLKKATNSKLEYTVSKDIKLLNMGPFARNFTMFSIHGHMIPSGGNPEVIQNSIENDMNNPDGGCLYLWNMPFQSRVYLHGPSIIALDNPQYQGSTKNNYGAYNLGDIDLPGISHAYQYTDTFYGLSYYPAEGRALFPPNSFNKLLKPSDNKNDAADNLLNENTVSGGFLPDSTTFKIKNILDTIRNSLQDTYFRGTTPRQNFMPGGPFCRTPWKYAPPSSEASKADFAPNQLEIKKAFPKTDKHLRIEHRWDPDDPKVGEATNILARVFEIQYNFLTGDIKQPSKELIQFSLSYFNNPDPKGFLEGLGYVFGSIGSSIWNQLKIPFQAGANLFSLVKEKFWPSDPDLISASTDNVSKNLFPTNFKFNHRGIVTKKITDETHIPRADDGAWQLDGVYWLDTCQIETSVTYVGTGTIVVTSYNSERPFKIKGDIIARRDDKGLPLGHLNIIYHPYSSSATNFKDRMLSIEGPGITIEASVYSCYGIKTNGGRITDFPGMGIYPDRPSSQWASNAMSNTAELSNVIFGNYVNMYMNLRHQDGDLWIIHPHTNPLYYRVDGDGKFRIVQDMLDNEANFRLDYEVATHEFFMSPKLQHIGYWGGSASE